MTSMTLDEFVAELKQAARGLFYREEPTAPIEVVTYPGDSGLSATDVVRGLAADERPDGVESVFVDEEEAEAFFDPSGPDSAVTVHEADLSDRFGRVADLLIDLDHLLMVTTSGPVAQVFVLGLHESRHWVGLKAAPGP